MPPHPLGRQAGILVPLFSCPSTRSWGLGEIADIQPMATWLTRAHQSVLQLLPINETAPGEKSPYSAISAMAIDPQFITLSGVDGFAALGGEAALDAESRRALAAARGARQIEFPVIRAVKRRALRAAFERFLASAWRKHDARAAAFDAFVAEESWWLDDYTLFRALHAREAERPWTSWPEPLRRRDPKAMDAARAELANEILFYQYQQWIAQEQWQAARRSAPVALFGDFPFMVAADSADVWARQDEFRLDASVGVPPDAFSATGQDWGMPVYRWEVVQRNDFAWLRQRARRSAALFDGYRIDHVVGFYRTYFRPLDGGQPSFTPAAEDEQLALGERVVRVLADAGPRMIAEDLGTVPRFVRASLGRMGIPGYRVLRWEREWDLDGKPFRDPADYPPASVATSGTHDTEPLAVWWESAPPEERVQVAELPTVRRLGGDGLARLSTLTPRLRDVLLETLFASGSELLVLPIQDLFGWRDRINEPAKISEANWSYQLPWPVDELERQPEAAERAEALRRWTDRHGRSPHAAGQTASDR